MLLDNVVNDIDLGVFHAQMLSLLKSTFPQTAMDLVMREQFPDSFQSAFYPANGDYVSCYLGGSNQRKIMYLGGMETARQASLLIDGYAASLGVVQIPGPNIFLRNTLPYYVDKFAQGHFQDPEYIDIVGYSLGGALAIAMTYEMTLGNDRHKKKTFTYGAPRSGGAQIRDVLARSPIVRYMAEQDPIPLIPPRLQEVPQMAPFGIPSVFISWSSMVHCQGGVVVNADGSLEEAVVPPNAAMTTGVSLVDWLFSLELTGGNPHSLSTYIAYLRNAAARRPRVQEKKVDVAPAEVPADLRRVEVNQARDRQVTAVANAQKVQNAQIAVHPDVVLFKAVRMGRVWIVTFGDKIVCQGVRADTARHLARAGNDFLKSLPKQALVDPIGLAAQFEAFLAFASSPDSEWRPTLRTNLEVG